VIYKNHYIKCKEFL